MKGGVVLVVVTFFVATLLLLGIQPVASSAFDPGDAKSADSVGITADGPIKLTPQDESGVTERDQGDLLIDAGGGVGTGISVNAQYTFGDVDAPIDRPAFTITNTDTQMRDIQIAYTGVKAADPDPNVKFQVYDADGSRIATISEENSPMMIPDVESNETLFGVVVIDTHGLTPEDDLSGSVTVRAESPSSR